MQQDRDITDISEALLPCEGENPHICTATTSMADFAQELALQAYSCLANTPNGLPSGYYVWHDQISAICCDELAVSIMDSRRFTQGKFGEEILNVVENQEGGPIFWQHEYWITLLRPCVSILNQDGGLRKASDRNIDGYNFMVDVQTMICCLEEWMMDEAADVCGDYESYYFRPAKYDHVNNCARVSIPLVVGGNGHFKCNCCEEVV